MSPQTPTSRQPRVRLINPNPPGWLRPLDKRDVPALTGTCQDPESARWTTVPVPYTEDHAVTFVTKTAPEMWTERRGATFAIADTDDAYRGTIDLRISTADRGCGEVGFMVAPTARGQGFAPNALLTLSVWGFQALGLQRVVWRAHVGNDSSRRVATKAGFIYEGIQRGGSPHRGERRDTWVAALLPDDLPETLRDAKFEFQQDLA